MTLIPTLLEVALAVSGLDLLLNALAPLYIRHRAAG
jgi:hypothetical protein